MWAREKERHRKREIESKEEKIFFKDFFLVIILKCFFFADDEEEKKRENEIEREREREILYLFFLSIKYCSPLGNDEIEREKLRERVIELYSFWPKLKLTYFITLCLLLFPFLHSISSDFCNWNFTMGILVFIAMHMTWYSIPGPEIYPF